VNQINKAMSDLECPYCGEGLEVNHDDGDGYAEDENHQMECSYCEKQFVFQTSISYYYEPAKADCLNEGEHDWKITLTYPKEFSKMRCSMCAYEKELTDNERKQFDIGTRESYFETLNKAI